MMLHSLLLAVILVAQPVTGNRVTTGSKAIDFSLTTFSGKEVTLSEMRGKVVLLDFWASWCEPCREELPYLDILQKTYGKHGFEVVAVNIDNHPTNAIEFLKKYSIKLSSLWDEKKQVVSTYDVESMPTTMIIDQRGWIRFMHNGFVTEQFLKYKQQIEYLLKEGKAKSSSTEGS